MKNNIPENLFKKIKQNVPLSCVDLILIKNHEFFLVKRDIHPYKGKWCLPGGIIKRGQKINDRLKQAGREELGIRIKVIKTLGFYEKIYRDRHDISHCFIVKTNDSKITLDHQASKGKFFRKIPNNVAPFHYKMLRDAGLK